MKGLKKISTIFLFYCLPFGVFSQPVYTVTEDNLKETILKIQDIYGAQIELSFVEIYDFLLHFVENTVPEEECPPPHPQIDQQGIGSISFSWSAIPQASYYKTFYLNLKNGANGSGNTDLPQANYSGLRKLNLFGFQSHCDEPEGPVTIIVADLDVLMPGDPPSNGQNCLCTEAVPMRLHNGPGVNNYTWTLPWPGTCKNTKYRLRIDGQYYTLGSPSTYHSDLSFIHDKTSSPQMVYLIPDCDNNALSSSENPLYVGSQSFSNYYNLSFTTTAMIIDAPASNLMIEELAVDVCKCPKGGKESDGGDGGENDGSGRSVLPENGTPSSFMAFPNPGSDYTQLVYELSEDTEVAIAVYDVLGRKITQILPNTLQSKGQYQLQVDMSNWPKGNYSCQLSTAQYQKNIFLTKE